MPKLQDVSETIVIHINIRYPEHINQYPALVAALRQEQEYALAGDFVYSRSPPHFTMRYEMVARAPEVVAVFGQGARYDGGLHDNAMFSSHIWLPQQKQWLTAQHLFANRSGSRNQSTGWQALRDYVLEQLMQQYVLRNGYQNVKNLSEQDRLQAQKSIQEHRRWVERGTEPENEPGLDNYRLFYPLMNRLGPSGRITTLRFVFPPYQVGSWADGIWQVDVPAHVLRPHASHYWRNLLVQP